MNVLVAYASRHGSTRDIAEAIADQLSIEGHHVTAENVGSVQSLFGLDAVVLGSGIYMGRWLGQARTFVDTYQAELSELPVWLFSSGPLGHRNAIAPADIEPLSLLLNIQDHVIFDGCLDLGRLGMVERMISRLVRTPRGDFRDWQAIRGWSFLISRELNYRSAEPSITHRLDNAVGDSLASVLR